MPIRDERTNKIRDGEVRKGSKEGGRQKMSEHIEEKNTFRERECGQKKYRAER